VRGIVDFFTSSIQRKILSSFAIVIALLLVMVSVGFYQLNQVRTTAKQIPQDSLQLATLQDLTLALTSLEANLERLLVIGGAQFKDAIARDLEAMLTAFEALQSQENFGSQADDDQAIAEVKERLNSLAGEMNSLMEAEYADLSSREINQKIISINTQIDSLKKLAQALSVGELNQLQQNALDQEGITTNVIAQFLVLGSLVALIVVGASIVVTPSIATPLARLAQTANQIAEGDLEAEVPVVKQKDEVGKLATAFGSMTDQLRRLISTLEERTQQLGAVTILTERLNTILDFDQLLLELVHQVKDTFGYYHAQVYIIDPPPSKGGSQERALVIAAGTGKAGQQMKAQNHRIALDAPTNLVARAARRNEIVSVNNVREAPDWLPNPLLPDTYSEMAVPIVLDGQVVGVLDVQEDRIAGLDEGDANLLRALANQAAVAMRNARLFNEVETALAEAHMVQARYLEQSWEKAKVAAREGQYHYARPDVPSLDAATLAEAKRQVKVQDKPVVLAINGHDSNPQLVVAPVTLRNTLIGALQLHPARADQTWTEDDLAIVEAVIDELGQTAENLRLFDETRQRAGREQTIREITDKLRAAPNLQRLVEIATQELTQRLPATHAKLELGLQAEDSQNGNGKSNYTEVELL
jgi:GAF domain-containing protein/HAMP domain-containing protein